MVSHDIFGTPGRGKCLHEPNRHTQRVIFIIIFVIDGFIIRDAQEMAGDDGNGEGE